MLIFCLQNMYLKYVLILLLSMLKTVVLIHVFVETIVRSLNKVQNNSIYLKF